MYKDLIKESLVKGSDEVMHKSAGFTQGAHKVEVLTYNYDAECDRQSRLFDY